MENAKQLIRRHMSNDRGVEIGAALLFEMTRQTAVDNLVAAIASVGGEIISITETVRAKPTGIRTNQTVYSVVAIIPRSVID